jgi:ferredoxin-NADP reductase
MPAFIKWQLATLTAVHEETPNVRTLSLRLPEWTAHRPGQHYDVRLTAPDGYQAERSYSIASEPERRDMIDLTVERIDDGEVSPYLHDELRLGDQLELRGPIGGYFAWTIQLGGPLLLIGGGSGVVPLMAMIRHRVASKSPLPIRLLYSSRTPSDVIYADELERLTRSSTGLEVFHTFTRKQPPGWTGYRRRIDRAMLSEVIQPFGTKVRAYICGPTLLVESAANSLLELAIPAEQIRTERFGPTGN